MNELIAVQELEASQTQLLTILRDVPDADLLRQYHPDLSPLAWHLGHTAFMEALWIREVVLGDDRLTAPLTSLFRPELSPKAQRGERLAKMEPMREFAPRLFSEHLTLLADLYERDSLPELLRDDYLVHFLIQHNQQHAETVMQVLQQRAASVHCTDDFATPPAAPLDYEYHTLPASEIWLGADNDPESYDNEQPRHSHSLGTFSIAMRPVSNAEYLSFVLDDGYRRREFWSDEAWAWRSENQIELPDGWRRTAPYRLFAVGPRGPEPLFAEDAVSGLSYYEAQAFARFAHARLPNEAEWEHAARTVEPFAASGGQAWEWCDNAFYPYPGFRAFPYDGYSLSWFDGQHRTLRGASRYTADKLRRPTFRNFYLPDKRHIFAGLRLAFDA